MKQAEWQLFGIVASIINKWRERSRRRRIRLGYKVYKRAISSASSPRELEAEGATPRVGDTWPAGRSPPPARRVQKVEGSVETEGRVCFRGIWSIYSGLKPLPPAPHVLSNAVNIRTLLIKPDNTCSMPF